MTRLALALLLAAVAAVAAGPAAAATPALHGTVGPGFTISLTQNGKAVKTLRAGTYRFVIADKASFHDFVVEQASGGTFERALTTVPFTGSKTVTLRLGKGKWEFYCAPHRSLMHGAFTVR